MTRLFGTYHTAASLAQRTGNLSQIGGVRLATLEDGAGRGMRVLDFATGSGLNFTVSVDRAMDISALSHKGRAIGWQSAAGMRHPGLHNATEDDGLGWNRGFTGFLATCGLDHTLGPETVPADTYGYPRKATVTHGLHGRISNTPARLTGYGEAWSGDTCTLWAEGVTVQATIFGEVLHLHRRIEADLGGNEVRLRDRVVNAGYSVEPHMFMYHVNFGYPLLDKNAEFVAPIAEVIHATHAEHGLDAQGIGYRTVPEPRVGLGEQVWQHDMLADAAGLVPMALINDHLGFGLEITTRKDQLPVALQWQNFRAGEYVLGLEPSTHHLPGNNFARDRDEMIWLPPGAERPYDASFRVLDGAADLSGARARIAAISGQPENEYPQPTGIYPKLHGAASTDGKDCT